MTKQEIDSKTIEYLLNLVSSAIECVHALKNFDDDLFMEFFNDVKSYVASVNQLNDTPAEAP